MHTTTDIQPPTSDLRRRSAVLRPVLWVLLVLAVAGNTAASAVGAPLAVNLGFGAASALCVVPLVLLHLRGRH